MVTVVTGATGGIGHWIALGLALSGARVVLVGRDRARDEAAVAWIAAQVPCAETELLLVDLSYLAAAHLIGERHPRIDVLVNNASIFATRGVQTAEEFDHVLATNHLSPFLLTQALLLALSAARLARVVNVGSSTTDRARLNPDALVVGRLSMMRSYAQSKLAMILTTFAPEERLAGSGVTANVVHPGMVAPAWSAPAARSAWCGAAWPASRCPRNRAPTPRFMTRYRQTWAT